MCGSHRGVGAELSRGNKEEQAHEIGGTYDKRTALMGPLAQRPVIVYRAVRRGILHEGPENVLGKFERGTGPDEDTYPQGPCPRPDDLDVLRVTFV